MDLIFGKMFFFVNSSFDVFNF